MTEDEFKQHSADLIAKVVGSHPSEISADDPSMILMIMMDVICQEFREQQQRLFDDFADQSLKRQQQLLNNAKDIVHAVQHGLEEKIYAAMQHSFAAGNDKFAMTIQQAMDAAAAKVAAATQKDNSAATTAKHTVCIAFAAATLAFMGGIAALLAVIL